MSETEIYIQFTKRDFITYAAMLLLCYIFFHYVINNFLGIASPLISFGQALMSTLFLAWMFIMNGIDTGDSRIETE